MVKVLIGNLFESNAQTLVNTVNCVGIMGKGVALEFKKRFPEMFADYAERCLKKEVKLGRPYLFTALLQPWVLNFPTKDHWQSVANIDKIIEGLEYLLKKYKEWGIISLAVPPLGCGEGQLEWRIVGPTLYRYLSKMDIPIELYAPYGTRNEELQPDFLGKEPEKEPQPTGLPKPKWVQPGWVALVEILKRIEDQPYHWPVGRVIFQKLAYVATQEGLPTQLNYRKGSYGPFAPELKGVISRLSNNGLIREERLGQMLSVRVGPTYDDAKKSYNDDLKKWDSVIEKIADLFIRLNSEQAEITATVLFAAQSLKTSEKDQPSECDVFDEVLRWKQRRRPPLKESEVALTVRNLTALGWLQVKACTDLPLPAEDLV